MYRNTLTIIYHFSREILDSFFFFILIFFYASVKEKTQNVGGSVEQRLSQLAGKLAIEGK